MAVDLILFDDVMYRGNTHTIHFQVKDEGGNPQDIANYTVLLTGKRGIELDAAAPVRLTSLTNGGITKTVPASGNCDALILPAHTSGLPQVKVVLQFDIEIYDTTNRFTVGRGYLTVKPKVTDIVVTP